MSVGNLDEFCDKRSQKNDVIYEQPKTVQCIKPYTYFQDCFAKFSIISLVVALIPGGGSCLVTAHPDFQDCEKQDLAALLGPIGIPDT